ncbi:hypothetical protein [Nonomuraea sp. NPDC049607]
MAGPGAGTVTALHQSALYLAVSLSGAAGALGLEWQGPARLPWLAAPLAAAAAALTAVATRRLPR